MSGGNVQDNPRHFCMHPMGTAKPGVDLLILMSHPFYAKKINLKFKIEMVNLRLWFEIFIHVRAFNENVDLCMLSYS